MTGVKILHTVDPQPGQNDRTRVLTAFDSAMSQLEHGVLANSRRHLRQGIAVRLFGITRVGLAAMTLAVAALWSCIAMENHARHQAETDARVSFDRLRHLRQDPTPAATPLRWANPQGHAIRS